MTRCLRSRRWTTRHGRSPWTCTSRATTTCARGPRTHAIRASTPKEPLPNHHTVRSRRRPIHTPRNRHTPTPSPRAPHRLVPDVLAAVPAELLIHAHVHGARGGTWTPGERFLLRTLRILRVVRLRRLLRLIKAARDQQRVRSASRNPSPAARGILCDACAALAPAAGCLRLR
jgi:hypothetical protein